MALSGYDNYITGALSVWINNDREIQGAVHAVALRHESVPDFADWLKGWAELFLPAEDDREAPLAEFITWGMTSVNWDQLAGHLWRSAREK